jgi:hypothetical protein
MVAIAIAGIDFNTLALLSGMMVLVTIARRPSPSCRWRSALSICGCAISDLL